MTTRRALDQLVAHVTACDTCRTILDYGEPEAQLCNEGESWLALLVSYRLIDRHEAKLRGTPDRGLTDR